MPWVILICTVLYLKREPVVSICDVVGKGNTTVRAYIQKGLDAILAANLIKRPKPYHWQMIKDGFGEKGPFNNCIGAVDGTIIEIYHQHSAGEGRASHCARKAKAGINALAICDHRGYVYWLSTRGYGSAHDSAVFEKEGGYQMLNRRSIETGNGYLLGDAGFRNCEFLLTPYRNDTGDFAIFNTSLSSSRMIIEQVFGQIKSRFRLLGSRLECKIGKDSQIIAAAFSLHNFFVEKRYPMEPPENKVPDEDDDTELDEELQDYFNVTISPDTLDRRMTRSMTSSKNEEDEEDEDEEDFMTLSYVSSPITLGSEEEDFVPLLEEEDEITSEITGAAIRDEIKRMLCETRA